jgi:hypothetical protein
MIMKVMTQFTDFYDDIGLTAALFYCDILNNTAIYKIANHLNNKTSDDNLAAIIANRTDDDANKKLFKNYLNSLGIKFSDPKRAVVAKVFYYILHDRIDFYRGIKFLDFKVLDYKKITEYVGDDVGIEQLIGNFYAVDDGDLSNEKDIETAIGYVIRDMKQYVNEHLAGFPLVDNMPEGGKKTVMETEVEEKVRAKAIAKGIEIKKHWEDQYRMARGKK